MQQDLKAEPMSSESTIRSLAQPLTKSAAFSLLLSLSSGPNNQAVSNLRFMPCLQVSQMVRLDNLSGVILHICM